MSALHHLHQAPPPRVGRKLWFSGTSPDAVFQEPALWFAKARLFPNRLELTGWRLSERYRRRIPLRRILQVDAAGPKRLLVWLAGGQVLWLRLDEALRWEQAIERRLEERIT